MKKILLVCSIALTAISTTFGQAKKPTIMVVPSDNWCIKNGYFMEFDNQGTKIKIPDYKKALQEDSDDRKRFSIKKPRICIKNIRIKCC